MTVKNYKCLLCGDSYHCCSSCDMPNWAWTYCTEECWHSSMKGMACLALGNKLAELLQPHEVALIKQAIEEEPHFLDRIATGLRLPRE
jgi:hypothetical protein